MCSRAEGPDERRNDSLQSSNDRKGSGVVKNQRMSEAGDQERTFEVNQTDMKGLGYSDI